MIYHLLAALRDGLQGDWRHNDYVLAPVVWLSAFAADLSLGVSHALRPLAAAAFGARFADAFVDPRVIASFLTLAGIALKVGADSFWRWRRDGWRARARESEGALVSYLRANRPGEVGAIVEYFERRAREDSQG